MEPLYDIICLLLETPFSSFNDYDKNLILSKGRPTPIITEVFTEKSQTRYRLFKSSWYEKFNWLCGSKYKQKLYCWPCILFSNIKNVWIYDGYRDYKNLHRSLQSHNASKEHIRCHMALKITKKCKNTIQDQDALRENDLLAKKAYNKTVRNNRLILEHLIDVTILLAKQELAFTSHNESQIFYNSGNFKEIFNLLIKRNPELIEHMEKIENFTDGQSNTIPNELISCVETYLLEYINNEILKYAFISLQVDFITDISQTSLCSLTLRYVTNYGKVKERFMGFYSVSDNKVAESLFCLIDKVLTPLNYKEKLVAQCYDGAVVPASEIIDLQRKIKTVAPAAIFTHCSTHNLDLLLQQGTCCIDKVRIFFATVTSMSQYFHQSANRSWVLNEILKGKISNLICTKHEKFVFIFKEIQNNKCSSAESISGASGFLEHLESFTFNFLAAVFNEIFNITDPLVEILQKKCLDVTYCYEQIDAAIIKIQNLRNGNNFEKIYNEKLKFVQPKKLNENEHKLENNLLYIEILDNIIVQMNTRFSDIKNYTFMALVDFSKSLGYTKNFPENDFRSLFKHYLDIFDANKLKNELSIIYKTEYFQNNVSLEGAIDYVNENDLQDVFSEFYKLLTIILTIPSISVCVERNFSAIQRIKSYLRNTTGQKRLSALALISIEKDLLTELSGKEQFYDDIINKFANMEECRIDLLYK